MPVISDRFTCSQARHRGNKNSSLGHPNALSFLNAWSSHDDSSVGTDTWRVCATEDSSYELEPEHDISSDVGSFGHDDEASTVGNILREAADFTDQHPAIFLRICDASMFFGINILLFRVHIPFLAILLVNAPLVYTAFTGRGYVVSSFLVTMLLLLGSHPPATDPEVIRTIAGAATNRSWPESSAVRDATAPALHRGSSADSSEEGDDPEDESASKRLLGSLQSLREGLRSETMAMREVSRRSESKIPRRTPQSQGPSLQTENEATVSSYKADPQRSQVNVYTRPGPGRQQIGPRQITNANDRASTGRIPLKTPSKPPDSMRNANRTYREAFEDTLPRIQRSLVRNMHAVIGYGLRVVWYRVKWLILHTICTFLWALMTGDVLNYQSWLSHIPLYSQGLFDSVTSIAHVFSFFKGWIIGFGGLVGWEIFRIISRVAISTDTIPGEFIWRNRMGSVEGLWASALHEQQLGQIAAGEKGQLVQL